MTFDFASLITAAAFIFGILVWSVRQEGRISVTERSIVDLERRLDDLADDIHYIRERIDRAIGSLR